MGERGCMHDSANKDTNGMVMVMKKMAKARDGYNNKDKNVIPVPHTRERKPVKKYRQHPPSCLEQLFNNLVIRNLRDICATIIHPSQHVDLQQTRLVSREEKLRGYWYTHHFITLKANSLKLVNVCPIETSNRDFIAHAMPHLPCGGTLP